ncbi:hypothetical protein OH76DRAFT_1459575 [Lentinus brumalis]|uniref:Fungal-type protein kinase domain-containing protein n=1 Tax=Lentinus brumalis TaxID=2498619 RepID=A0A371CIS9_9APHY|nr:hypothetical protein OH76DRAFT_1459575 [Polyporus brumalis]
MTRNADRGMSRRDVRSTCHQDVCSCRPQPRDAVAKGDTIRRYIVSRPVISPLCLVGKGTRGFWAVDALSRKVVFLKDTWRTLALEGDTLERLSEKGVRNIPPVEWHGEVPDFIPDEERKFELYESQMTIMDEYCSEPWVCALLGQKFSLNKRVHYRLVLGIAAMSDARTLDSRIHRDISLGNIVLVAEPGRSTRRGYRIDWDASCKIDDAGAAVYEGHAGTWEFMSAVMLDRSGVQRRQTLEDDMESLFYVVLYCAFLWLPA